MSDTATRSSGAASADQLTMMSVIVLTCTAMIFALVVGVAAYRIMSIRYASQPLWVEQCAYLQHSGIGFLEQIRDHGRWTAVGQRLTNGIGNSLQLVGFGLVAPRLLTWPHAHLIIVIPTFAVFLLLLGTLLAKSLDSIVLALGGMLTYCSMPGLLSERHGIGAGFSDYQAMLFLACGALCLLHGLRRPARRWLVGFAVSALLCVLGRASSVTYLAVICGPILLLYFVLTFRRTRSIKSVVHEITLVGVLSVPTMALAAVRLDDFWLYRNQLSNWGFDNPLGDSLASVTSLMLIYMGKRVLWVCLAVFLAMIGLRFLTRRTRRLETASDEMAAVAGTTSRASFWPSAVWWVAGFIAFLVLGLGFRSDIPKEVMYAAPAVLLVAFAPVRIETSQHKAFVTVMGVFTLLAAGLGTTWKVHANLNAAAKASPSERSLRQSQYEMAGMLATLPYGVQWQTFAQYDWKIPVACLAEFKFGRHRVGSKVLFWNSKQSWQTYYPDLTGDDLGAQLYADAVEGLDVAIVLEDPDAKPPYMDDTSYGAAAYIARRVSRDSLWKYHGAVSGEPYNGTLAVYLNTKRVLFASAAGRSG